MSDDNVIQDTRYFRSIQGRANDEEVVEHDEPQADGEYVPYRTVASAPPRLRLIDEMGMVFQPRYFLIDDVMAFDKDSHWLALILSQYIIVLYGRHLDALLSPLQEEKVRWIQCYNPEQHYFSPEKSKTVVKSIKRYSPEEFKQMMENMMNRGEEETPEA